MPPEGGAPPSIHPDVFKSLDVRVSSGGNEFRLSSWGSGFSSFPWRGEATFMGDLDRTGGVTIVAADGTQVAPSVHFAVEDLIDPTR